jgi:signal transduction histidine kinase
MEVVIERPDRSRITALVNIAPLFGNDGKLVGAVNCFQDLSAIKLAERERVRLSEELHQAKKLEAIGQLAARIVHDFNNLLASVHGNLELLTSRTNEARLLVLLRNATRSVERGEGLTQRFSRSRANRCFCPKPSISIKFSSG